MKLKNNQKASSASLSHGLLCFFVWFGGKGKNLARLSCLGAHFVKRLLRRAGKSARAMKDYLLPPWESNESPLEYLVLASGAKWVRQGDPAWNLVESPRLEKKPAVRELFDYYGTPTLLLDRGEEEVALRLDEIGLSLLEAGFGISVEDIERPYCRECTERQIKSVQRSEECGTYPERRYRCEKCKDRDMSLRLLQPAVDDQRGLHFLHNVIGMARRGRA